MAKMTIEINLNGAAFEDADGYEESRILHELADTLLISGTGEGAEGKFYDVNGNACGSWKVTL